MNYYCMLDIHPRLECAPYQCYREQCYVCKDYQAGITKPAYPMPTIPYDVTITQWYVAILTENSSGLNRLYPDD